MAKLHRGSISCIALLGASLGWAATVAHLDLERLDGTAFALPEDLRAKVNVLVIGFTRKAGQNNRPWMDRLEREFRDAPNVETRGVAVLAGVPRLFRRLALDGVKGAVSGEGRKEFLVAFSDESSWKNLVGYESPDDPYILILDRRGEKLAGFHGVFGESAYAELAGEISRALAGEGRDR